MGDFIAKYGIFSGIGVVLLTVTVTQIISRMRRRQQPAVPALPHPSEPLDVEVIPLWFLVSLNQQIPDVRVYVQIINYSKRELRLSDVSATYLRPDEGPPLENIPAGENKIPPRRSWHTTCRRTLLDAETKALLALPWRDQRGAALEVRVRGVAGKKTVNAYSGGLAIRGWITGLPSHPSVVRAPTG
jgi:hypothetical protein